MSSAAAAASTPRRTHREDDRAGMMVIVLSPFISAISVRQLGHRLRWSCTKSRRLPPSSLPRYARNSGRSSAQTALPAFATFSQTRARASSIRPASTPSARISSSARSKRSSDIVNLLRNRVLTLHLYLQPLPDSVEPYCHVVLLHLEHRGQLFK